MDTDETRMKTAEIKTIREGFAFSYPVFCLHPCFIRVHPWLRSSQRLEVGLPSRSMSVVRCGGFTGLGASMEAALTCCTWPVVGSMPSGVAGAFASGGTGAVIALGL